MNNKCYCSYTTSLTINYQTPSIVCLHSTEIDQKLVKHVNRTYCMKPHASVSLQNGYQLTSTQHHGTIGQLELTYPAVKISLSIY